MSEVNIDIYRICSVTPEVIEATERLTPLLSSGNQATINEGYLERIVCSQNTYWLGAKLNSDPRIIGMATLTIMPMITNIRAGLENVVVDESARGLGVGIALCLEAKEIANNNRVNTLRAAADKENLASLGMLSGAGFVIETEMHYLELDIQQGNRFPAVKTF